MKVVAANTLFDVQCFCSSSARCEICLCLPVGELDPNIGFIPSFPIQMHQALKQPFMLFNPASIHKFHVSTQFSQQNQQFFQVCEPGFTWKTSAIFRWSPWPGLNAATLLAALAPIRLGLAERPGDAGTWSELLQTAQLEVQGELLSLIEMEQVERGGLEMSAGGYFYIYIYIDDDIQDLYRWNR